MIDWVKTKRPKKVVLVTECSMASNVAVEAPDVEFIRPCNLCPHMKRISLESIYDSLVKMRHEVTVDPDVAEARPARGRAHGQPDELSSRNRSRPGSATTWSRGRNETDRFPAGSKRSPPPATSSSSAPGSPGCSRR